MTSPRREAHAFTLIAARASTVSCHNFFLAAFDPNHRLIPTGAGDPGQHVQLPVYVPMPLIRFPGAMSPPSPIVAQPAGQGISGILGNAVPQLT